MKFIELHFLEFKESFWMNPEKVKAIKGFENGGSLLYFGAPFSHDGGVKIKEGPEEIFRLIEEEEK